MEKKIIDRLNILKSQKEQQMIKAKKMGGRESLHIQELNIRINELQRLIKHD